MTCAIASGSQRTLVRSWTARTPRLCESQASAPERSAIPERTERTSATSAAVPVERATIQTRSVIG